MVKRVAVIGSGIMGQGIAQVFIRNGMNTLLIDINDEILKNARNSIENGKFGLGRLVEKGTITEKQKSEYMEHLKTSTDYGMLKDREFVIEAVPEIMALKLKVMENIEKNIPNESIIASNTSGIMISEIGMNIENKSRLIGMHWFNPAPVMKLIEVVKTSFTSGNTINAVLEMARSMGKEPVVVKDYPGFFTTNFVHSWIVESLRLYEKGIASKEDIDKMARLGFGFPMGPFELMDTIGLDTVKEIGDYLYSETGDGKMLPPPILKEMVYAGYKGSKKIKMNSRGGWYDLK
jgi:3-hydroxybutyryl-CoA dehydrogenase